MMERNRWRMVELHFELTTSEGLHTTILDGVKVRCSDRSEARTPVMYEPSIYIVASGRKKGYDCRPARYGEVSAATKSRKASTRRAASKKGQFARHGVSAAALPVTPPRKSPKPELPLSESQ